MRVCTRCQVSMCLLGATLKSADCFYPLYWLENKLTNFRCCQEICISFSVQSRAEALSTGEKVFNSWSAVVSAMATSSPACLTLPVRTRGGSHFRAWTIDHHWKPKVRRAQSAQTVEQVRENKISWKNVNFQLLLPTNRPTLLCYTLYLIVLRNKEMLSSWKLTQ